VQLDAKEVALVAVLSTMLGIISAIIYTLVYPVLPPIVIVPFVMCFFFGLTLSLTKRQFVIGLISFVLTGILKSALLPGQLMIPVYALLFQMCEGKWYRSASIVGFAASILHVFYGVVLAPSIFSIAPARMVMSWLITYLPQFMQAITLMTVIFGIGGMLAAEAGRRMGLRVFGKLNLGLIQNDVGRAKKNLAQ